VVRLGAGKESTDRILFLSVNLGAIANCMSEGCQGFGTGGTFDTFLGAFAKLRKATIIFVMSVRPSVCPQRTSRLPLDGLS
jgi:hypothetical protein